MLKVLTFYTAIFFIAATGHAQVSGSISKQGGNVYAVVIGISQYQSKSLPQLNFAHKDAGLFAKFLQSQSGGNVPAEHLKILINEDATIAAVYDAMDWLKETCKEGDVAYVYFSGHGDVETKNTFSLGYLLAYNTPATNYTNNAIRIEDISNLANTLSIKNKAKVVLITDACHSGKLAGDYYKGKQLVAGQLKLVLNNEVRIASCGVDEEAAEGVDWGGGRGAFSYYLLMGLNGFAAPENDGSIRLQALNKYLDSCFAADKVLLADNHKQQPVTDGNPMFPMSVVTEASFAAAKASLAGSDTTKTNLSAGLKSFKPLGIQPIDYFFTKVKNGGLDSMNDVFPNGRLDFWNKLQFRAIENVIDFGKYNRIGKDSFALAVINDCIAYEKNHAAFSDSLGSGLFSALDGSIDSLLLLKEQLKKNEYLNKRFIERFVQMVHEKGQDMINAYLGGDIAELEKRQYYFAGNRSYGDFISMLNITIKLVPVNHSLYHLLKVHQSYLSGLVARLQMATSKSNSQLLKAAVANQWQALQLEPYAAYIHNEIGNLYIHQKRYDSAAYHFNLASVLSPTWAIPWSNKIRLNLALNNIAKAKEAIQKADSLQPKLAYVMMNAGLVMEKDRNWLAAEAYYLKAIEANKVHFLPYERLAKIYLITGEYAKADTFLFATETRKIDFAVNDEEFRFGIELGGPPYTMSFEETRSCFPDTLLQTDNGPYSQYFTALAIPDTLLSAVEKSAQLIGQAVQQTPCLPLAWHYLGKKLYRLGKWRQAADAVEQAKAAYNTVSDIKAAVTNCLAANHTVTNTNLINRMVAFLECRQYDYREDLYLLGDIYEKLGEFEKTAAVYETAAAIENKFQNEQARYEWFYKRNDTTEAKSGIPEIDEPWNETPFEMPGSIKLSRLYENMGKYEEAEKILLSQVAANQAAGFARRDVKLAKPLAGKGYRNYYWININRNLESETYNFYKRMTERFPRDGDWKERAGLFLYRRLSLSFTNVPLAAFVGFSKTVGHFAYPFLGGEEPQVDMEDEQMLVPGTSEKLVITMQKYHPVKEALAFLLQSVKLSGDVKPKLQVLEALADVYSWLGYNDESLKSYAQALQMQPLNAKLRNKYINCLVGYNELPQALEQLDSLRRLQQITNPQLLQLANYQILSGHTAEAGKTLRKLKPVTTGEQDTMMALLAKKSWLENQLPKAVLYLKNLRTDLKISMQDDDATAAAKQGFTNYRQYGIARAFALQKNYTRALAALKIAIDKGFDYLNVLDNDDAFDKLRNTTQWNKLLDHYTFEKAYLIRGLTAEINPVFYRLPH